MYTPHPDFEKVEPNALLWRYLDLPRYIDLLLKNELFFCRADRFEDPFEGKYPRKSQDVLLHNNLNELPAEEKTTENIKKAKEQVKELTERHQQKRSTVTINSWHENEEENFAMWKIYAKGNYGLALQTTYEKLQHAFEVTDKQVYIGKVKYFDERTEPIPVEDSFVPFLRKRLIYQYEKEVRCCYALTDEEAKNYLWESQDIDNGIFIPVNCDLLIDKIYISPYSPQWFRELVAGINKKFGIEKEIVHSTVFESYDF
ncbi:MAG: hypothetical protein JWN76_1631 [Chitinophagaceae bacterium]|nr:hypothetical protein [Chitinophagaceae bacterium]